MGTLPLVKRYAPARLVEVVGQKAAKVDFVNFIRNFPRQKSVLFVGSSGIGKTVLVKAFANECGYELVELNASDRRNKAGIEELLLPACSQPSIFGNKKIILVDEVDSLSGTQDRGGAQAIAKVIAASRYPVILIANDGENTKLKALRKISKLILFPPLTDLVILEVLKKLCGAEEINYEDKALELIASTAEGDLRAAINDLEIYSKEKSLCLKDIPKFKRKKDCQITAAVRAIINTFDSNLAEERVDSMQGDYDLLAMWLDENLRNAYRGCALHRAYDALSKSDIFGKRIIKRQHWRFLVYIRSLLTGGVQHAKNEPVQCSIFARPTLILKLWQRNMRRAKYKAFLEKIAEKTHTSVANLERDFLPFFAYIQQKKPKLAQEIMTWANYESISGS